MCSGVASLSLSLSFSLCRLSHAVHIAPLHFVPSIRPPRCQSRNATWTYTVLHQPPMHSIIRHHPALLIKTTRVIPDQEYLAHLTSKHLMLLLLLHVQLLQLKTRSLNLVITITTTITTITAPTITTQTKMVPRMQTRPPSHPHTITSTPPPPHCITIATARTVPPLTQIRMAHTCPHSICITRAQRIRTTAGQKLTPSPRDIEITMTQAIERGRGSEIEKERGRRRGREIVTKRGREIGMIEIGRGSVSTQIEKSITGIITMNQTRRRGPIITRPTLHHRTDMVVGVVTLPTTTHMN